MELIHKPRIILVAGPTASGKTAEAIRLAKELDGEVISVDSRQVYRRLNIGTEKITTEEMQGIPHHLIDIREPSETYSAGEFVTDATRIITVLHARGKMPILAGGTHFYFDALLYGLPEVEKDETLRTELEQYTNEELLDRINAADTGRAASVDPHNRRRLIRALEIIAKKGSVAERKHMEVPYEIELVVLDPSREELRARIDARLTETLSKGLIEEVASIREEVGDGRLNEFGLEYKIVGEYLRGERTEDSLFPALSAKLWQYAKRQKNWLRKLQAELVSERS